MQKILVSTLSLVTFLFQISCNKTIINTLQNTSNNDFKNDNLNFGDFDVKRKLPVITVTNLDNMPMEQAKVLIGNKLGQPFVNNLLETNKMGQVIAPADWSAPLSITVDFPGYMRVTYFNVFPQDLTFKIRPIVKTSQIVLTGKTTNFGKIKPDNVADFGLVIQSLNRGDLFSFNIDKLISPEFDNLKVGGFIDTSVPSNLTFPHQQEKYVVPITIEKEKYRLFFREPGLKRSYALHGQFPFKETMDQFRNKVPFTTLINSFKFVSGGLKEFQLDGPLELDLPVNEMSFTSQESLQPPTVPSNYFMLSISLFEINGLLYPTDMHKADNTKPFILKNIEKAQKHFLSVIAMDPNDPKTDAKHQEASSIEFVAQSPNHIPHFLDLIPSPTPTGVTGWTSQAPALIDGVTPLTTFAVLSKIITEGDRRKIQRNWEVYAENWIQNLELPEWPENNSDPLQSDLSLFAEGHRWEIVYIGTNSKLPISSKSSLGPDSAELTSHVSFNSVEF